MEDEKIKDEEKLNFTEEYIPPKKKIITSYDKNNEAYYNELNNSREPTTVQQSFDYYELLKQQIKYYQELNSSLKEEIETVKECKRLKEQDKNFNILNQKGLINSEIKKEDLKKEPNFNLINTLDEDKDIFLTESKNSNPEEKWIILKNEMRRLEDENQFLKNSVDKLNDTINNMKYPDEENNSCMINNISFSINKEENNNNMNTNDTDINDINIGNKLLLDNNRLKIYIEKIVQMQKLLTQYESQINSLTEELKQKNEKIRLLIYKVKPPNMKDDEININQINEDIDMVNLDKENENKNGKELINQEEQLNEIKKEYDKLKAENDKLKSELNNQNLIPGKNNDKIIKDLKDIIKNNEIETRDLKNKLEQLLSKIDEDKNIIKDLEKQNEAANKKIQLLNNNNESDKNNLINKLESKNKELENEITLLKRNKPKFEPNIINQEKDDNKENQIKELLDINEKSTKQISDLIAENDKATKEINKLKKENEMLDKKGKDLLLKKQKEFDDMKTNMKIDEMKLGQEHKLEINRLNNTIEQMTNKNNNFKKEKDNEIAELNYKINELKNQIKFLEEQNKINLKTNNNILSSEKRKIFENKNIEDNNYKNNREFISKKNEDMTKLNENLRKKETENADLIRKIKNLEAQLKELNNLYKDLEQKN